MKKLFSALASIILIFVLYTPAVSAKPPRAALVKSWTKTWGGSGSENANHIAVDSAGSLYVAGEFSGSVDFDPAHKDPVHNSNGAQDAFLVKLDAAGNFLWARTWGGSGRDTAYSVAVDSSGNAYVTGPFRYTVDFDPGAGTASYTSQANSGASNNVYFSKFDKDGSFQWVKTWGPSNGGAEGYSIAVDPSDNMYLVGDFNVGTPGATCDFNPWGAGDLRTTHGFYDGFITKFDAAGSFLWVKTWGGGGYDDTTGVALDGSDSVYVTGMYGSTDINFDPAGGDGGTHNPASEMSVANVDAYMIKFSPDGAFQWVRSWGSAGTTEAGGRILVDHDHNVYFAGRFECSNCNLNGTGSTQEIHSTNGGLGDTPGKNDFDAYVTKYDANGNFLWARTWGGSNWDAAHAIAVDDSNNLYVTGIFNHITCNPAHPDVPPVCPSGFSSTVDFDPGSATTAITSNQYSDAYLGKFDPSGNFLWVKTWGSNAADFGNDVAVNSSGDVFAAGSFNNTVDFDAGPGVDSHTSSGVADAFLSKFTIGTDPYVRSISGTVTLPSGGALAGVTISDGAGHSTLTAADGTYTLAGLAPQKRCTLTAAMADTFIWPSSQVVNISSGDVSGKNFVGKLWADLIPTSLSPADLTTLKIAAPSVVLKWKLPDYTNKKQIGQYRIQVASDSAFTKLVTDKTTGATSFTQKALLPHTTYYWRVQALFKNGYVSKWAPDGAALRFNTVMLKPPALGAPANNSRQTAPMVVFAWSKPAGAPSAGYQYVLQCGTDINFAPATFTEVPGLTGTKTSLPLPLYGLTKTIYWRVKLSSSDGSVDYSDFQAPRAFVR